MKYIDWCKSPLKLTLSKNEVHIWQANLDLPAARIKTLAATLSEDETQRANRFRFNQHRDRFIAGRGILRELLGNYLELDSNLVNFEYSSRGKPRLIKSLNKNELQFNISHSQNLALFAFNYQRIIGIDIEYIKDNIEYQQLAQRFFANQELILINSYKLGKQKKIFFQLWTAKEAYLKATGKGLAGSLDQIVFTLDNHTQLKLLQVKQDTRQSSYWLIDGFIPEDNFIAAVAMKFSSIISNSISTKFFQY